MRLALFEDVFLRSGPLMAAVFRSDTAANGGHTSSYMLIRMRREAC